MKQVLVGGQLVGRRSHHRGSPYDRTEETTTLLLPWQTFPPLVTPRLTGGRKNEGRNSQHSKRATEQFVLLPNQRFVTVLAYKTGKRIAYLVPFSGEEDGNDALLITSATLAMFPARPRASADVLRQLSSHQDESKATTSDGEDDDGEDDEDDEEDISGDLAECHVLLLGCNDGTIREFSLIELTEPSTYQGRRAKIPTCGPYQLSGICLGPRRVIQVSQSLPIIHLSSVGIKTLGMSGLAVYGIFSENQGNRLTDPKEAATNEFSLRRVVLTQDDCLVQKESRTDNSATKLSVDAVLLNRFECPPLSSNIDDSPFALETVFRDESSRSLYTQEQSIGSHYVVFVVVACTSRLSIFCDFFTADGLLEEKLRFPPVVFGMLPTKSLSALTVSTNGTDIACGHFNGEIRVLCDALTAVSEYYRTLTSLQGKADGDTIQPKSPTESVIIKRVHWHAHPVASLAYQSTGSLVDPILYSGGDESVLVTWHLSRGTHRPSEVLPRLAKGGIICVQIVEDDDGGPSGILIASEDNTLQLFESHNKSCRWKIQGLAYRSVFESSAEALMKTRIWTDPGADSSVLVLTGLPDAPGYIHWYDTREQRVSGILEVAPYNRVSKSEREDSPMPTPAITHCAFGENGSDLVTVDITPTENSSIGAKMFRDSRTPVGTVSTIRFWSYSTPKQPGMIMPYQLIAAMTFPHGPENFVSALTLSRDGQCCCTVSNGENAIRLWHQTQSTEEDDEDDDAKDRRRPLWQCRYRITSPSGFSNMGTRAEGVAFSTDGSILAICYGNMITLWDHQEASFLTSLLHLEDDRAPIDSIQFLPLESALDMILTKSASGVSLQSPFSRCGSCQGWSWMLPSSTSKDTVVTDARVVFSHELVAISTYCRRTHQSRIVFVDVITGDPTTSDAKDTNPLFVEVEGEILSISTAQTKQTRRQSKNNSKPLHVSVLTNEGELIMLQDDDAIESNSFPNALGDAWEGSSSKVPRLLPELVPRGSDGGAKRPRTVLLQAQDDRISQKLFLASFGSLVAEDGSSSTPVPSTDLPSLAGGFARAFIGRNIARQQQQQQQQVYNNKTNQY